MSSVGAAAQRLLRAAVYGASIGGAALVRTQAAPAEDIRVVELQGTLQIMTPPSTTWVFTTTNQSLQPGDFLRIGPNSRVSLRWSDRSVVSFDAETVVEILPPHVPAARAGLQLLKGILSFFHREEPGRIRILTHGAMAGVEGTEFVVAVASVNGAETTTISLIDGRVEFSNEQATLHLTSGQQAVAQPGQTPVLNPAGFVANNVLQWCFYYPGVLDLQDLPMSPAEQQALGESLAAYRSGDVLAALAQYPDGRQPGSDTERVYHAALLLSVGRVEEAETALARLGVAPPSERLPRLAAALRQLVAAVKRQPSPSTVSPQLSTELLAASYYEQSLAVREDSLQTALALAREAARNSPAFGFAWARVAEIEFSFGRTERALDALNTALAVAPRNAQALALKGFLLAARNQTSDALAWFNRAIALDPALGNAWLGRGLCRIRSGDPHGGLEDLHVAAALEPQRSLLRSYLAKAYVNSGDLKQAGHELELARRLDLADPTSWLYSAYLNREKHRFNEAIDDLEESLERNDNRRVYRSRLLLDQDRAVRSSSLAAIYRDAGMIEVSVREAARAVTYDYANYSAHLFLANSYDALRDPTRFNLRYETPWFSELLLANLLAPASAGAISPNISQQEYARLFERDRLGLTSTTELRSDGQYREVASQFGTFGRLSYSLDVDWQHNEGVRPNNELSRIEWYSQIKMRLTPQDSLFVLTKYQDYHSGDNFQYFDPQARTVSTNLIGGVTTNTAYRPHFTYDEAQNPIALAAYHREWSPGIHTLALGGRLLNDQQVSDRAVTLPVLTMLSNGQPSSLRGTEFDVQYQSRLRIGIGEVSQIFQGTRNMLLVGGRFQAGDFETRNYLTNVVPIVTAFFPATNQTVHSDFQRWSLYAYDTWEAVPHLHLTAGLCYDNLEYPQNHRQVPITAGDERTDQLGPKAAVVWSPSPVLTLRGAYSRSLGGVSLDESYRLEPAQLAGFIQTYRTIISESVVGSVSAPKFETIGSAVDLKLDTRTYIGLLGQVLSSDVDRVLGVYRGPNVGFVGRPSSTPQRLNYDEYSASLIINQLLSDEWGLGASYTFTRSELDQVLPELSGSLPGQASRFDRADLHKVSLYLLYQHSSGFFGRAEADWYWQQNSMSTNTASGQAVHVSLPGDEFPQLNFWVGYRLPRLLGDISIGLLNATGTDYKLNPLNPYAELPRERVVAARVRFRF